MLCPQCLQNQGYTQQDHKHAPNYEEIKEEMELYNADEIGIENPITMEEAEYNLLNSDKYNNV